MQVPVLGALFKSRDYVNRQTELMVLVTPYVVARWRRRSCRAPTTASSTRRDPATVLLGRLNRIYGATGKTDRRASIAATTASFSTDRRTGRRTMTRSVPRCTAARSAPCTPGPCSATGPATLRLPALRRPPASADPAPPDYRQRHPIAIKEGERTGWSCSSAVRAAACLPQRADVDRLRACLEARVDRRHHPRRAGRARRTPMRPAMRCARSSDARRRRRSADRDRDAALSAGRSAIMANLKLPIRR